MVAQWPTPKILLLREMLHPPGYGGLRLVKCRWGDQQAGLALAAVPIGIDG
jgi:hypothetical protein